MAEYENYKHKREFTQQVSKCTRLPIYTASISKAHFFCPCEDAKAGLCPTKTAEVAKVTVQPPSSRSERMCQ